jgi:hypothetical protein
MKLTGLTPQWRTINQTSNYELLLAFGTDKHFLDLKTFTELVISHFIKFILHIQCQIEY